MLSLVVPVYNERQSLGALLVLVSEALADIEKEIVLVDDGSTDGTREWLRKNLPDELNSGSGVSLDRAGDLVIAPAAGRPSITFRPVFHTKNRGKGGAVQTGLAAAQGDIVVIQDADLEYDPHDLRPMYDLIARRRIADVVYGTRFHGAPHRSLYFHHYAANRLISFLFNLLYNQTLSDIEVCYKMFTREVKESLRITAEDFGFEVQISAQVALARRWRIYETAISYYGRTYEEGKKINWRDGLKALWYLLKYRVDP
ncbi:MAG TPA: glycosyltransferase family 2 protein [Bauldia sp.]|nr:glycosyltransferase family 2 protein [Bauldia sp.]